MRRGSHVLKPQISDTTVLRVVGSGWPPWCKVLYPERLNCPRVFHTAKHLVSCARSSSLPPPSRKGYLESCTSNSAQTSYLVHVLSSAQFEGDDLCPVEEDVRNGVILCSSA